ncbi:MAG TPA: tetratricopeptide repeat protein [Anaerolineae bacterium]|nr:tetratricopeptide repeat protein [Anaerolineae bacterium]
MERLVSQPRRETAEFVLLTFIRIQLYTDWMSDADRLQLKLFGHFQVIDKNIPLTPKLRPRAQRLLVYLLLHRHMPRPRQSIAFTLWPDSTEEEALGTLRRALSEVRATLPPLAEADWLTATPRELGWNSNAPHWLDLEAFEQLIGQTTPAALHQAVTLYRGDLLPEWDEEWLLVERERLRQIFSETLERLVVLLEAERDYRAAISYAQRLLRYDPLREETYQLLMRLYALSGDRTGALRVYQTCVAVLKRELDVEVSPATRETYEQVVKLKVAAAPAVIPPFQPRSHNLPIQLASFIGRERELAEVKQLLQQIRLLTLTGPGGCGKTRLALQVATEVVVEVKDGAWFVELASLSDPALVLQAVVSVLGVHKQPNRAPIDTLTDHLQTKELLLILDNCEHLLTECARLGEALLRSCAHLRILATSRERLNVLGETVWRVPSLSLPASHQATPDALMQSEAVHLFIERAAAVLPTFGLTQQNAAVVVHICRRLDGIPLAIELAAARVRLLTPAQIADRLDDLFQLLTHGSQVAPPRHQTLRAAMDWSYALLSQEEQGLFQGLAVFAGGWSLEAAETVCKDDPLSGGRGGRRKAEIHPSEVLEVLSQLIDKSLVVADMQGGEVRYRMLEPIRQYAAQKLPESGEAEQLQERHCQFFLKFAEEMEPKLKGLEQVQALDRLDIEHDNLRAALRWALDQGNAESGLRLAVALKIFWVRRDYLREGHEWTAQALARTEALGRTQLRALALNSLMNLSYHQGHFSEAEFLAETCLEMFQQFNDKRSIADTLRLLGWIAWHRNDYPAAQSLYEQGLALYREVGDKTGIADFLHMLGHVTLDQGQHASAQTYFVDSLALFRELGDKEAITILVGDLGLLAYLQDDFAAAHAFFEESLGLFQEVTSKDGIARVLNRLGDLARCQGDYVRAEALYHESLALFQEIGGKSSIASALHNLGYVAQQRGDYGQAVALFRQGLGLFQEIGDKKGVAECLMGLAGVIGAQGDPNRAARLFGAAEALREIVGVTLWPANRIEYHRNLAVLRAHLDEDALAAAWAEGRAMTMEMAIEQALTAIASW